METKCSWQQADYELLSARGNYVPNIKLDQKSFKQQSLKWMPLLPWLQHFHTNNLYNLLLLPEDKCFYQVWRLYPCACQSYEGTFLKNRQATEYAKAFARFCPWLLGEIAPLMPILSSAESFTPWKSGTNSEQTNSRVKMGQGSRWATVVDPLKESNSEQQERNKCHG